MNKKQEVERRLRALEGLRAEVARLEQAMEVLTPEERLVVQMMLICPEKGSGEKLSEILQVDLSTIYRRKAGAVRKLEKAIFH